MYPVLKSDSEYKDMTFEQVYEQASNFPVELSEYIKVWHSISKAYKKFTIEANWCGGISKIIEDLVYEQFSSNQLLKDLTRSRLNPFVIKLMEVCRLRMETQLAEKYSDTLEIYLRTLIRFTGRDSDFFENSPQYKAQGMDKFDDDIHFDSPMIKTVVKIKKFKERDESGSKYCLYTKPNLMNICKDLFNITNLFLNALSGIRRIDESVFPQLTLKKNVLRSPDQKVDPKLVLIAACINFAREKPQEHLKKLNKYIVYLDISTDSMILSMKKRSYSNNRNYSNSDGSEDEKESSGGEGEDDDEVISEDDEDAYKNIDITDEVYIEEFKILRGAYWDVQRYTKNIYDFGLVQMDCQAFLKTIVKHLDKLISHLTAYLRNDFLARINHILIQYQNIEHKVSGEVNSIDEVIYLIEFIDNIKKPEQKLEELLGKLELAKIRKDFIDNLFIILDETDFNKYLNMLTYPKNLLRFLDKRRNELESERSRLSRMMDVDIKEINKAIVRLKKELDEFKTVGMYFTNKKELEELNIKISEGGLDTLGFSRDQASKLGGGGGSSFKSGKQDSKKSQEGRKAIEVYGDFDPIHISNYASRMESLKEEFDECQQRCDVINRRQSLLSLRVTKFAEVFKIKSEIKLFVQLWSIADKFREALKVWMDGNFEMLDAEEIDESVVGWWKALNRLSKSKLNEYYHPMNLLNYLYNKLEEFKEYLPMITALRTKGITERHWEILSNMFNINLDPSTISVRTLLGHKLYEPDKLSKIKGVSDIAIKEYAIQTTLENLENEIRAAEFTTLKYKDTNTHILRGIDELVSQFEEFSIKIAALRANQLSKNFNERVSKVEKDIKIVEDVLEEWTKAQKSWMYLEPIFQSEDISNQMPAESQSFQTLDSFYRQSMKSIVQDPSVIRISKRDGLHFQLQKINAHFEIISRGLSNYLEAKREFFSRFYFLSNEEIIEILGQMREPRNIQRFLNKIFEGIDNLSFQANGEVTTMHSKEGETVRLVDTVMANESAESWLRKLEGAMKKTIKAVVYDTLQDKFKNKQYQEWVKMWPGQIVLVVTAILFTKDMSEIMRKNDFNKIQDIHKEIVDEIDVLTSMVRSKITDVHRTTMSSLITSRVHDRDQVHLMIKESKANNISETDFIWQMYMKFYYEEEKVERPPPKLVAPKKEEETEQESTTQIKRLNSEGEEESPLLPVRPKKKTEEYVINIEKDEPILSNIKIAILNAERKYGYEYLGNTPRLVITPLTDRCHRSLFMALHYGYGGSPEGPVGTGKTETTKDLAKCLAKHCFVFNCSSTLNFAAMTKFFIGLATSGAWSCFDEFNRISLSVLSVISQTIIVIQGAIRENLEEFMIEETKIKFNNECAIFITMNPMYSGRTELPHNLKSLFRPVSMIIPDSMLISEILLYSYGFVEAKSLAQKIVYTFILAKQQLSHQVHYDFGLRAIKIILSSAGVLKLKASGIVDLGAKLTDDFKSREEFAEKERRLDPNRIDEGDEEQLGDDGASRRRSRQFKLKSKASTKDFKNFKKMKKSLKRKETKRNNQDSKDAAATAAANVKEAEEQKGINYSESSLSSKDVLNKDDLSVSSLDSEDIIYTDQKLGDNQTKIKDMVYQMYKGEKKLIPVKGIETPLKTKIDFISDKKKGKTMASEQLIDELGLDSADILTDDKKIEEFIVLRAIKDTNLPKFHDTDALIFEAITLDIFQTPMKTKNKHTTLKNLIESVLSDKG